METQYGLQMLFFGKKKKKEGREGLATQVV